LRCVSLPATPQAKYAVQSLRTGDIRPNEIDQAEW
jgi:hypothetical protein